MATDDSPRIRQEELQRRIREAAYLLWEAAGPTHGRALEFWLAAERELLSVMETAENRTRAVADDSSPADPAEEAEGK